MKAWEDKELELAISMIESKKTYKEISEKLNRSERSIREKLRRNGYKYFDFIDIYENLKCMECNEIFTDKKVNNRKFCTRSCSVKFNNKFKIKDGSYAVKNSIDKNCKFCSKTLLNKERVKTFCNTKCQKSYERIIIYKKIEDGTYEYKSSRKYKDYLIEKYDNKCMKCNWCEINKVTGKVPIQLEHIDGNSNNNNLDNLELLCPNCHSLTETYGYLNKGNGRDERKKYRDSIKNLTLDELIEIKIKMLK